MSLELIYTKSYPCSDFRDCAFKNSVLLGIGGNIGDVLHTLEAFLRKLKSMPYLRVIESSPVLKNPPFGYLEQPDFYNAVVHIKTNISYIELFRTMKYIEGRFGRKKAFKNAPRTLDIDIIFFGNMTIKLKTVTIPHPKWQERESVVVPISLMRSFR